MTLPSSNNSSFAFSAQVQDSQETILISSSSPSPPPSPSTNINEPPQLPKLYTGPPTSDLFITGHSSQVSVVPAVTQCRVSQPVQPQDSLSYHYHKVPASSQSQTTQFKNSHFQTLEPIQILQESQPTLLQTLPSSPLQHDSFQSQQQLPESSSQTPQQVPKAPVTEPPLNDEQQRLVDLILTGQNVFYTGAAGTGKSRVLRAFVHELRMRGKHVDVVAPTGIAALAVGGSTTWTYAGLSPANIKVPVAVLRGRARKAKRTRQRIRLTDCLVIDEISMVENFQLERLNHVMQATRAVMSENTSAIAASMNARKPFGGCQIVVTGDFCQLPPVRPFRNCIECGTELIHEDVENEERNYVELVHRCPEASCRKVWSDRSKWAFMSEAWKAAGFVHVELQTIHRQAGDPRFINILNNLRRGLPPSPLDVQYLMDPSRQVLTGGAVRLYPTKNEVSRWNMEKFNQLRTEPVTYRTHDSFIWNKTSHPLIGDKGDRNADGTLRAFTEHRFEPKVVLKKGMLVVLLVNVDITAGLVNGSTGVICGFEPKEKAQLPLKGDVNGGPGMSHIMQIKNAELKAFAERAEIKFWPVVKFLNVDKPQIVFPECSIHEVGDTSTNPFDKSMSPSVLSRTQIPLMAAWAMTTHKSQGMTLSRVIIDLTRAFEEGQVYVALSRARNLEGLKIEGAASGLTVGAGGNKEVGQFYRENFGHSAWSVRQGVEGEPEVVESIELL